MTLNNISLSQSCYNPVRPVSKLKAKTSIHLPFHIDTHKDTIGLRPGWQLLAAQVEPDPAE